MATLLKWKHKLLPREDGYRLDMLAVEDTPVYLGGLVGGRVRWFEKASLLSYKIKDGRALIDMSKSYVHRRGLLKVPENP